MKDLIAELERAEVGSRLRKRIVINQKTECWLWQGGLDKQGRGRIWTNGCLRLAHREVWRVINGPIQNGKLLCHICDNPQCVNPKHLYVGTQKDNVRDMMKKGRHWTTKQPVRAEKIGRQNGLKNTWAKGAGNPKAKLTEQQVRFIRADPRSTKYLVADYGVDRTTIQRIRRGASWQHLKAIEHEKSGPAEVQPGAGPPNRKLGS